MNYRKLSLSDYSKELASKEAVPGGGSAAAAMGEMGISLGLMVGRIMLPKLSGKKKDKLKDVIHDLKELKLCVGKVVNDDVKCYGKVMDAYKLTKTDKMRNKKIQQALNFSYESMRNAAADICGAKKLIVEIKQIATGAIANDIKVSEEFLKAAFNSMISH